LRNSLASDRQTPPGNSAFRSNRSFPKRSALRAAISFLSLSAIAFLACNAADKKADAKNDEQGRIVDGMVRAETSRFDRFQAYTRIQHYAVTSQRFNIRADMVARIRRDRAKGKTCEVISRSGSTVIQSHVFDPLLEAEIASSQQSGELVTPENYSFHLTGQGEYAGHHCYVLETDPKHKDKRLLKGRLWLDTEDFGIVHMEGRPSDSLSFWVGRPMIVQDFAKISGYWWVSQRHSYVDNMLLGKSDLVIDYSDYQFEPR
jgi:hypothetical protein